MNPISYQSHNAICNIFGTKYTGNMTNPGNADQNGEYTKCKLLFISHSTFALIPINTADKLANKTPKYQNG